jgi:hypothetical protein
MEHVAEGSRQLPISDRPGRTHVNGTLYLWAFVEKDKSLRQIDHMDP